MSDTCVAKVPIFSQLTAEQQAVVAELARPVRVADNKPCKDSETPLDRRARGAVKTADQPRRARTGRARSTQGTSAKQAC